MVINVDDLYIAGGLIYSWNHKPIYDVVTMLLVRGYGPSNSRGIWPALAREVEEVVCKY